MVIFFLSLPNFLSLCVSVLSVKNAPFDMARSITISVHWGYIKKKKVAIRKYHRGWNSGGGGCHDVPSCVRIFSKKVVTSEWHVWYVRILYFLDMEKMSYFGEWWQNLRAKNGFFVLTDFFRFQIVSVESSYY